MKSQHPKSVSMISRNARSSNSRVSVTSPELVWGGSVKSMHPESVSFSLRAVLESRARSSRAGCSSTVTASVFHWIGKILVLG